MGKQGVVRDPAVHREVISRVAAYAQENGFELLHLEFSPIKGPEGNIEYLLHLKNSPETAGEGVTDALGGWTEQISCVVEKAHGALD